MTDISGEVTQAAATSKQDLLERMRRARERFDRTLERIPRERFLEPGRWGDLTLKDLVAHVAAYERWTAEQMVAEPPREQQAAVQAQADAGVDALNRWIYEQHRDDPLDAVLAESPAAHAQLRATIQRLPDDQVHRPQWWTGDRTLLEMIPEQSDIHYGDHIADLERAAKPAVS